MDQIKEKNQNLKYQNSIQQTIFRKQAKFAIDSVAKMDKEL